MRENPSRNAALAGAAALAAVVAGLAFDPTGAVELLRARAYDRALALARPSLGADPRIVVVDIDEASLAPPGSVALAARAHRTFG